MGMNKLQQWLESERGLSTRLATELGIAKTNISQAKFGRLKVPAGWIKTIVRMSKGAVKVEDLLPEYNNPRKTHRKDRSA